jgi:hypothetical protein
MARREREQRPFGNAPARRATELLGPPHRVVEKIDDLAPAIDSNNVTPRRAGDEAKPMVCQGATGCKFPIRDGTA